MVDSQDWFSALGITAPRTFDSLEDLKAAETPVFSTRTCSSPKCESRGGKQILDVNFNDQTQTPSKQSCSSVSTVVLDSSSSVLLPAMSPTSRLDNSKDVRSLSSFKGSKSPATSKRANDVTTKTNADTRATPTLQHSLDPPRVPRIALTGESPTNNQQTTQRIPKRQRRRRNQRQMRKTEENDEAFEML
jgi:hypothetical protein